MAREGGPISTTDKQLLHDLRQAIAAGILVTDPVSQDDTDSVDDLRQRLQTVRHLLGSMMEMLAPRPGDGPERRSVDIAAAVRDCVEVVGWGREVPVTIVAL